MLPYVRLAGRHGRACEPYDLTAALVDFDADVVVVQEAFRPDEGPSALDDAAAKGGYELHEVSFGRASLDPWPHISRNGEATGDVGIAVLSRLPTLRTKVIPLRVVAPDPAPSRQALQVTLDVQGVQLDVVGVHLSSRLPHAPIMQLRGLRSQLPVTTRHAVVAGDFNLWGPVVGGLLEGWRRPLRERTWPAQRPHSQIDHVLVRDTVQVLRAEVLDDVGSDHRPIKALLAL